MGSTPKVSVIMPVYNAPLEALSEAIDSVLSQSFSDLELICVDDGSTDGSPAILREYSARDPRVRVITQEHAGPGAARNRGLEAATGEYIAFLDADDLFEPEALQTLYAYAELHDLDELFFLSTVFYESESDADFHPNYTFRHKYPGTFSGRDLFILLTQTGDIKIPVWMQFLRKEFLSEETIWFREGILMHEDDIFTMECLAMAQRVRILDTPLHRRRVRNGSVMTSARPFDDAYGFFICAYEMLGFAKARGLESDREYLRALTGRLDFLLDKAARSLLSLGKQEVLDEMALLDDDEYAEFGILVYERMRLISIEKDYDQLYPRIAARIDIKNIGSESNDVEIFDISDPYAEEDAPSWFDDENGIGHVVSSGAGSLCMSLRCIGSGELQVKLKGADVMAPDGVRTPVWIDYTSLLSDGAPAFNGTVAAWHDRPYRLSRRVDDGQIVSLALTWHSHDEQGLEAERERLDALNRSRREAERSRAAAENEVEALHASRSWKIGRAITWLPRKVKDLFKA